jgi:DNA-binding MarR family transcriptional regulator
MGKKHMSGILIVGGHGKVALRLAPCRPRGVKRSPACSAIPTTKRKSQQPALGPWPRTSKHWPPAAPDPPPKGTVMAFDDEALEIRAQGWLRVAAFHSLLQRSLDVALQDGAGLSASEYTVLEVISRQRGVHHMRMHQLSRATVMSASATTRLVHRLEVRGFLARFLCVDDRRGIYTELTGSGAELLGKARPIHDKALRSALVEAETLPELIPFVDLFRPSLTQPPGQA